MKPRKWNISELSIIVQSSNSIRQVIYKLGLIPAGGTYHQISKAIEEQNLDISHFKGQAWNKGLQLNSIYRIDLEKILTLDSNFQSFKLKKRLFSSGLKKAQCEECGWAKQSDDGRIPLELDHINGIRTDNRLENLRVLCPNCHSLKPTHRGRNIHKVRH